MNTGKIVLGVVGGIAIGALLGVLFAPEKGSITRRNISRKGEEYMDDVKDKFNEIIENITDKFSEAK